MSDDTTPAAKSRRNPSHVSHLTHLECTACKKRHDADRVMRLCPDCGKVLFARYDLEKARLTMTKEALALRPRGMWRWHEIMPVRGPHHIVSLGEGDTPLLPAPKLGDNIYIKEEGLCPTGSFKARGISAAISRAHELGVEVVAIPSAGNAASALAAYGARAGMRVHAFMPVDTPLLNQKECVVYGAHVTLVRGLISDCAGIVRKRADAEGWFDVSTLKEPYRAEGKKTMGLELAEQFGWSLPDVVVYPTGGGTGIVGMWKAWDELEAMGLIGSKRPRMISVQAEGCAPIVRAFEQNLDHAPPWENANTRAAGLRVPGAVADYLILKAIRDSGGTALAVSEDEIAAALRELAAREGIFAAPEGAATWAAAKKLYARGVLRWSESVVLFNTGTGLKYPDFVDVNLDVVDP
ncbi:threonine synthase [Pendulispora brunnea]|uniref:Threonine synthase n=1 Tax=Pendulispora brunnea TaxID=2905690 RepID=A0ABZ2JWH3_9BACT